MSVVSQPSAKPEKRKTTPDYEAMANELLAGMAQLDALMRKDRIEIEHLKKETLRLEVEN